MAWVKLVLGVWVALVCYHMATTFAGWFVLTHWRWFDGPVGDWLLRLAV